MADSTQQQLRRAYELIKAKKRQEAVKILLPILQADEDNANAWWLLANSLNKPEDVREALENVLRLRPDHANAQKMLDRLNEKYPPPEPEPEPEPEPKSEPGDFGFGDSASDPFAGADQFAATDDSPEQKPVEASAESADPFGQPDPFGTVETFGTVESFSSTEVVEDDPFSTEPAAEDADPFGAAEVFGSAEDDDPFAAAEVFGEPASGDVDPFAVRQEGQRPKRKASGSSDDLFGGPVGAPAPRARRSTKKGTNPLVIVLAIIGGLALCACVACVLLVATGSQIANQIVQDLDIQGLEQFFEDEGFILTLEAVEFTNTGDGSFLPSNVVQLGGISYGDSRQSSLNSGEMHAWTFSGRRGDQVRIDLMDNGSGFDPYVMLYDPSNLQIAFDDDSGGNFNSRLSWDLPADGTYTIVVRGFGDSSGSYTLNLQRR